MGESWKTLGVAILAILGGVASFLNILDYFGLKPELGKSAWWLMSTSRKWKLAVMLAVATLSLSLSIYSAYRVTRHPDREPFQSWKDVPLNSLEQIRGKHFENEVVEIDGKDIERCTFHNVRLLINGNKVFALRFNSFTGSLAITTDDSAARRYAEAIAVFDLIRPEAKWNNGDNDFSVTVDTSSITNAPATR